jgi:ABC-type transport system substrate-binding protein
MGQVPEMPEFTEAVAKMWQKVGLQPKLIDIEFGKVRTNYRGKKTTGFIFPFRILVRPAAITHFFQTNPDRFLREYTSPTITQRYTKLEQTIDPAERDRLLREMGNEMFEQISNIPIAQFPLEVAVNPDVVKEYTFFGPVWGNYVSLEYVKGVR